MIHYPLARLAKILSVETEVQDFSFQGLSTDTRSLQPGNLFIALKGDNHDGHLFLDEAQKKGAVAALVMQKQASALPQIRVTDTLKALGLLAAAWRKEFKIPLVGLTGSCGKTTLKNMIASILRAATSPEEVMATEGNLNNHIGVPLMLARLNEKNRYAVIEMGMNHFGELTYLTHLACPEVAIINNAAPAHLQGVSDLAGVARAKGEIFQGLRAEGMAILNFDDTYFSYWKGLIGKRRYLTFGLKPAADVHADLHPSTDPLRQELTIITPQGKVDVRLPLLGRHNALNALAATAACLALNIELSAIKEGLELVLPANGRLQLHKLRQEIRLIDDTYNANPASLQAAVQVLASFPGNKILILGDMRELGDGASEFHAKMGRVIRDAGINQLFTYGELSEEIAKSFGKAAQHFAEQEDLIQALQKDLPPHSTLLVKGSRKMKMEKVVEAVKEGLQ